MLPTTHALLMIPCDNIRCDCGRCCSLRSKENAVRKNFLWSNVPQPQPPLWSIQQLSLLFLSLVLLLLEPPTDPHRPTKMNMISMFLSGVQILSWFVILILFKKENRCRIFKIFTISRSVYVLYSRLCTHIVCTLPTL
jgi:hypothetical protein